MREAVERDGVARAGGGSASGRRPAAAFACIGAVFALVAARAAWIHLAAPGEQPGGHAEAEAPWPTFEIVDRAGTPLAVSVDCFDVTVSPSALWRSHTPRRIAERVAGVLGDRTPAEVLERAMPPTFATGPDPGWLRPDPPVLLRLDAGAADRVRSWIERDDRDAPPVDGLRVVPLGGEAWTVEWAPAVLLDADQRVAQLGESARDRPERWTRALLRDLVTLVGPETLVARLGPEERADVESRTAGGRAALLRDAVWSELLPCRFRVLARRVDASTAHALAAALRDEGVSPWQVQLHAGLDRRHPTRPDGEPAAPTPEHALASPDDAFALLGHWGVLGPEAARSNARRDRDRRPHVLAWDGFEDPVDERAYDLQRTWRPWSGLELLCMTELEDGPWRHVLEERHRRYARRVRSVARDRRRAWGRDRVPGYFEEASDAAEVPRFEVTIDAELQEFLHAELGRLQERCSPALSMAIALDVETAEVLAVGARSAYPYSGFAPLRHVFTPGSTMKAVVMAIALDAGRVRPETRFPTYHGSRFVVRDGSSARHISEAEGAPEEPEVTAAVGLAESCNAVLVQVGLRVPPAELRDALVRLGYGRGPGAGLGPEAAGYLPPLKAGTWSRVYTHASVSFGHEIGVTLWQHAAALATLVRGGTYRPLRLLRAVEQDRERWELPAPESRVVLGERACAELRAMMQLGAAEGTGARVAAPELHPDLAFLATKTGTTEKVETELCLHVELPALAAHAEARTRMTRAQRRELVGRRDHEGTRRTCYTSSMCVVGRRPGGREVLVLVVADDPRGKEKFGADVAGPHAVAVLRRAVGLPAEPGGDAPARAPVVDAAFTYEELPWAAEPDPNAGRESR